MISMVTCSYNHSYEEFELHNLIAITHHLFSFEQSISYYKMRYNIVDIYDQP